MCKKKNYIVLGLYKLSWHTELVQLNVQSSICLLLGTRNPQSSPRDKGARLLMIHSAQAKNKSADTKVSLDALGLPTT